MKYITHRRFKGLAICGRVLNLPYGTKLICENGILKTKQGEAVCMNTSENAKLYFAINDDGKGLERGKYTYAIAYSRKGVNKEGFRFTDKQRDIIVRHYQRFLRQDLDMIIFNDKFFKASVEELKAMAKELDIKV